MLIILDPDFSWFEREEYKGRLKVKEVKELNSSFKKKNTLHKNKPGVSGRGGGGGGRRGGEGGLQPYLNPYAAKPRERLSAPFDLIYCRLLEPVLFLLHFLGNSV